MNHPNDIPMTLEANTREELLKKCLDLNMRTSSYHNFFDFQKDEGKWVCFFYENVSKLRIIREAINHTEIKTDVTNDRRNISKRKV